ncbi:twin-arginine translocase TatA/TatE family subunit [Nocardioides renjunii]|uniref:twin-arginine translocase TatA/TatE family subunit n=1 Tax=Nocardioides renjunii TaxID=3095075 RepID=UPI002AFDFBED|nr:twin-arginine translocase TatA/TatE family subunit [Nocardioides sp. S-34]WQQ23917.1 twin-arginine translocase TatA/TatE family subunit [Nocardioides sp. S-34]
MTSTTTTLLVGGLGGMELLIILAVLVLLFGASKLPELARGSGQALRIFKSETKGLMDDHKDDHKVDHKVDHAVGHQDGVRAAHAVSEPVIVETPVVETPREHDAPRG